MPTVVPNTPPNLAMSSPMTKILGSLRISAMTASRPARAMVRVLEFETGAGCAMMISSSGKDAFERFFGRRIGRVAAELNCLVHLFADAIVQSTDVGGGYHIFPDQTLPIGGYRIHLARQFVFGPIVRGVADEMP